MTGNDRASAASSSIIGCGTQGGVTSARLPPANNCGFFRFLMKAIFGRKHHATF
jgi:hypothetical protein